MDFTQFRQEQWDIISKDKFSFLKSIPSSYVRSTISLFESDQEIFTHEDLQQMVVDPQSISQKIKLAQFIMQSQKQGSSFEFTPIKEIKSIIKHRLKKCDDPEERVKLEKIAALYHDVSTPNAKETRKVFFPKLTEELKDDPKNSGGGCWAFPLTVNSKPVELVLDFGGRFTTFTYWVDVYQDKKSEKNISISYEKILGFAKPNWDLMRTDLLEDHVEVFIKALRYVLRAVEIAQ